MKFILGKNEWRTLKQAEERCYLLTNGLGGFSALSIVGSNARNDQALFMTAKKAPNERFHMVTNIQERVEIDGKSYDLASQQYVNATKNQLGQQYLNQFTYEYLPEWTYQVEGIEIIKTIVMVHGENTLGIRYQIISHNTKQARLILEPRFRFTPKDEPLEREQEFSVSKKSIQGGKQTLYYQTNAQTVLHPLEYCKDLYYAKDARDGRDAIGISVTNHTLVYDILKKTEEVEVVYADTTPQKKVAQLIKEEVQRLQELEATCAIKNETGRLLARNANQYLSYRESTKGQTILAGFPFFSDWGRDTMIALVGCTIVTRQFEACKQILRTFMAYCHKGMMPNLFPEGDQEPMYNTVDASLLFIGAVYEYEQETGDIEFLKEAYPVMEDIIVWYQKGTDYHIKMDEDGLIRAGEGLEQLTWMDVRIQDILPTPRHGKAVEINAYWYHALMVMDAFSSQIAHRETAYQKMAEKTKKSFLALFWNEKEQCLKDVISGSEADDQVRCNQIWAVSAPFCMLEKEQAQKVVQKVFEKLYTPYGLRSLSPDDPQFHPCYGGSQFHRDMAYHQGTVWGFPLGAYYLAYLRWSEEKEEAIQVVERQLEAMQACLMEGCIGHIAEIYDGYNPSASRGCFAQAWSVGEIVRVYAKLEEMKGERNEIR